MANEWQQMVKNTIAIMPRLGWPGRWDALLYALRVHKFLRTEEAPLTFSVWIKGGNAEVKISGAMVEFGAGYHQGKHPGADPDRHNNLTKEFKSLSIVCTFWQPWCSNELMCLLRTYP